MKKDLYQFLGSFLTAVMLVTDFGAVTVKAAPLTEPVSEVESILEEDINPVGDMEHSEDLDGPVFDASISNITTRTADLNVTVSGLSENKTVSVGVILTDNMSVLLEEPYRVTEELSEYQYDGSLEFNVSGTKTMTLGAEGQLTSGTTYKYRLFEITEEPGEGYPFITGVYTFTTASPAVQSHVTIGDVNVEEYGFEAERITFQINNPDNETITKAAIVDGSGSSIGEVSGTTSLSACEAVFPTSATDPAIRVSVSTGGGKTVSHTLSSGEIKKQDVSKRGITLSGNGSYTTITGDAELSPCYDIDRYMARLNYKKSTDTEYSQKDVSLLNSNGGKGEIRVSGLEEDTDYQYYITVFSAYDESHIIESCGSATAPLTYHTEKAFTLLPNSVYNWKLGRFEFVFSEDLAKGTKINAEIVSYDAELNSYTVMASASASVGVTAPVMMKFYKDDGTKYKINNGDDVYFSFYIGDKSVTPDPLQMRVRYFDDMTSVNTVSGNAPYTLSFCRIANPDTLINTISVGTKEIEDDNYFLRSGDVSLLDPDYIYTCVITDKNGQVVDNVSGYFTSDPEHFKNKPKDIAVKSLKITGARTMEVGERLQLSVQFEPAGAVPVSVNWISSNPEIASISSDGIVSANKVGNTTITLNTADGRISDSVVLSVIDKDDSLYVEFSEDERYVYTGQKITPTVAVYHHGKKLAEGVDYKVSYSNNTKASSLAKVKITGVTIPAKVETYFTIYQRSIDDDEIKAAELIVKSGKTASPVLYLGDYKLAAKDFTYDKNRKFTENGTLLITGQGNFKGSRKITVTVGEYRKFKVRTFSPVSRTYNGTNQYLSDKELILEDTSSKAVLKENVDYILAYSDACSAGTVKVRVLGIGSYSGSIGKTYKIQALKASGVSVNVIDKQTYHPGEINAPVEVTYKGKKLIVGKDYKLSYTKNTGVGKANVKVTFLGNYKGTSGQSKDYKIIKAPLSANNVKIYCADLAWTKEAKLLSTPYVTMDGMELTKSNYDILSYTISGNDISKRKVTIADLMGNSWVTVTVALEGKGNMTGKAYCTYRIFKSGADYDLSKAKIEIKNSKNKTVSTFKYTGFPIEINGDYHLVVTLDDKVLTEGVDYTVDYKNNIYKGKAIIIVSGLGENSKEKIKYYGSKTKNFTIAKGTIAWF